MWHDADANRTQSHTQLSATVEQAFWTEHYHYELQIVYLDKQMECTTHI
jgi:hypothetical protein